MRGDGMARHDGGVISWSGLGSDCSDMFHQILKYLGCFSEESSASAGPDLPLTL